MVFLWFSYGFPMVFPLKPLYYPPAIKRGKLGRSPINGAQLGKSPGLSNFFPPPPRCQGIRLKSKKKHFDEQIAGEKNMFSKWVRNPH